MIARYDWFIHHNLPASLYLAYFAPLRPLLCFSSSLTLLRVRVSIDAVNFITELSRRYNASDFTILCFFLLLGERQ